MSHLKVTGVRFRPLGDRVLVRPEVQPEEELRGGIFIPKTAQEKPNNGTIVAVGPGKSQDKGAVIPLDVRVGDKILYGKYSGSELKFEGETFLIMHQEDVIGILE